MKLDEVFPPIGDLATGDAALDAAIALQVPPQSDARYSVVSFVPGNDATREAVARACDAASADARLRARTLLLALAGVGDPIAALPSLAADDRPAFLPASAWRRALASALTVICARGGPDDVAVPVSIFATHPWGELRVAVGRALLESAPPREVLEGMAAVIDLDDRFAFARDLAVAAAVRVDPPSAFDRLGAAVARDVEAGTERMIRGLGGCLGAPALPFDPRWVPLLLRFLGRPGEPHAATILRARAEPAHAAPIAAFADAFIAGGAWSPVLALLAKKLGAALVPAMTTAVEQALATKAPWLAVAVDALAAIDSPATLERLRAAHASARGTNKKLLASLVERLARHAPPDAAPATAKPKPAAKKRASAPRGDPARLALRARLVEVGLGQARADDVVALARERVEIVARATSARDDWSTGVSRLGGRPDLPRDAAWPTHRGEPLAFVAQVALVDVKQAWADSPLPGDGLLSFFVRDDLVVDEGGDLPIIASSVMWTPADAMGDLASLPFPDSLPQRRRIAAVLVDLACGLEVPPLAITRRLGLLEHEVESLSRLTTTAPPHPPHALLGHARAGYYGGLPPPRQTLLLQHGSDDRVLFGDASSIFFCIPDAALKKRDFTKARAMPDEM